MGPIVLEGPDCSGKTTLARQLCRKLGFAYAHQGPPPRGVADLTSHYINLLAPRTVHDRLALSEMVYGPLLRDISKIDAAGWARFKAALRALGGTHVICLPPLATCLEAWRARRASELVKSEDIFRLTHVQFGRLAAVSSMPAYDWTASNPTRLIIELQARMKEGK